MLERWNLTTTTGRDTRTLMRVGHRVSEQRSGRHRPLTLPSPVGRGICRQGNGLARVGSHGLGHPRSMRFPLPTGGERVG